MLESSLGTERTAVFWSQTEAWFLWSEWRDVSDRLLFERGSRLNLYILQEVELRFMNGCFRWVDFGLRKNHFITFSCLRGKMIPTTGVVSREWKWGGREGKGIYLWDFGGEVKALDYVLLNLEKILSIWLHGTWKWVKMKDQNWSPGTCFLPWRMGCGGELSLHPGWKSSPVLRAVWISFLFVGQKHW